jgi:hypothetical protein
VKKGVSEVSFQEAHLLGGNYISFVYGDVVGLNDPEGFLGLELVVVMTVDSFLGSGDKVTPFQKVRPSPLYDYLVNWLAPPCRGKIDHFFEILGGSPQKQAQPTGDTSQVPYMNHRCSQLDMAHTLASDSAVGYLHAATVADDTFELGAAALVFSTGTLITFCRAKNAFAEKTVFFRS